MVEYCGLADAKQVLHFKVDEITEDEELTTCIATASGLVDGFLKANSLVVPPVVPQLIKDATANFAGWAYRRDRDATTAQELWNSGMQFLETYVEAEKAPYVGSA